MWWLSEINDYSETYYPIFLEIQRTFQKSFSLTQWRNGIFSGMPLFGDPLSMLLYPINWISLVVDLEWFFPLVVILSFIIGFWGMKKLLVDLKIQKKTAYLFALVYMLLPMSVSHVKAGHLNIYEALSLYPWVIFLIRKIITKQHVKFIILSSLFSALVLFCHPGLFYLLCFPLVIIQIYYCLTRRSLMVKFLWFWLLTFLLGAVYFLPAFELNTFITRVAVGIDDIVPVWSYKSVLGGLFFPYLKIADLDQEAVLYPTVALLIFAWFGFKSLSKKKKIIYSFSLTIFLLLALGSFTPFYKTIFNLLPFKSVFRVSSRFWYLGLIGLILLGAHGADSLSKKKRVVYSLLSLLLISELLVFASLRLFLPGRYGKLKATPDFVKKLADSSGRYRIYSVDHSLSQKEMAELDTALVDGEYPIQLKNYLADLQSAAGYQYDFYSVIQPPYQIYKDKPQPNADKLGLLNASYVISPYELVDQDFQKVDFDGVDFLYFNTRFRNYLWSDDNSIEVENYQSLGNKVEAVFITDKETRINWGQRNFPGWLIKVDGKVISPVMINSWFQFKVTPGRHQFTAVFQNRYFDLGLKITLLTLLFITVFGIKNCSSVFVKRLGKNLTEN